MRDVIGKGLFSNIPIRKGDLIVDFVGEFITKEMGVERDVAGFGGYMISYNVSGTIILDCYNFLDICKASMANCPKNCFDSKLGRMAESNATLSINRYRRKVSLRATKDIGPNIEILWSYGPQYRYPTFS